MASQAFKVLYTKQLMRKLKSYNDGFLIRDGSRIRLLDDTGRELATGRLPASLQLSATSEGITAIEGFLVDCDEELAPAAEVPRWSPDSNVSVPQPTRMCGNSAADRLSPAQQAVATPVAARLAGARSKFRPPRVADAPPQAALCPQPVALQGWCAADATQASVLGKQLRMEERQGAACAAQPQAPPPVHRSGYERAFAGSIILAFGIPCIMLPDDKALVRAGKRCCAV